jgi:hypothetical protein
MGQIGVEIGKRLLTGQVREQAIGVAKRPANGLAQLGVAQVGIHMFITAARMARLAWVG